MADDGASAGMAHGAEGATRPTRAELRRSREAAGALEAASDGDLSGLAEQGERTRLDVRREREAEARRLSSQRGLRGLLTAWWFYVVLVLVLACGYLAIHNALAPRATDPPIVVTNPDPSVP